MDLTNAGPKHFTAGFVFQCKLVDNAEEKVVAAMTEFQAKYPGRFVEPPELQFCEDGNLINVRLHCYDDDEPARFNEEIMKILTRHGF